MGEKQPKAISPNDAQTTVPKNIMLCELKGKDGRPKQCPENIPELCIACRKNPQVLWNNDSSGSPPLIYRYSRSFGITVDEAITLRQAVIKASENGNSQEKL